MLKTDHFDGATRMSVGFELGLLAGVFICMLIIIRRVTSAQAADTLQMVLEFGLGDM